MNRLDNLEYYITESSFGQLKTNLIMKLSSIQQALGKISVTTSTAGRPLQLFCIICLEHGQKAGFFQNKISF